MSYFTSACCRRAAAISVFYTPCIISPSYAPAAVLVTQSRTDGKRFFSLQTKTLRKQDLAKASKITQLSHSPPPSLCMLT